MRPWPVQKRRVLGAVVATCALLLVGVWVLHGLSSVASVQVTQGTGPGEHVVVALGDSVPAGAACMCTPFPELYGPLLARRTGASVTVTNAAVNGLDSQELLDQLREPDLSAAVGRADVVLITIGANDFGDRHDEVVEGTCAPGHEAECVGEELKLMRSNLTKILDRVRALRHDEPTTVLVTGYWNVFEDKDVAEHAFGREGLQASLRLTQRVNEVIRDVSTSAGAHYVDLFTPFHDPSLGTASLLAADGDHPDEAGHVVIADTLLAAGLPRTGEPH